jgi:hypothetical protein
LHFDSRRTILVALLLAGCGDSPPPPESAEPVPEPTPVVSTCGGEGRLEATLSGALSAELDWADAALRCESMGRPDDEGVRLRFTGDVGDERLVIIVAAPGLDTGATGSGFDAVVTVTVEGSGRFFSTPNLGACWADVTRNDPVDDAPGDHVVAGTLSCVGPLGEVNGEGYVDLREMRFSGIANWENS